MLEAHALNDHHQFRINTVIENRLPPKEAIKKSTESD